MVYRGKITQKLPNANYSVLVPVLGDTPVIAEVCVPKGLFLSYEPGEIVFITQAGVRDWVILGSLMTEKHGKSQILLSDSIQVENGTIGKGVIINGVSGEDIAKTVYRVLVEIPWVTEEDNS